MTERQLADAFNLAALTPGFLDDPYPPTARSSGWRPASGWRTASMSSPATTTSTPSTATTTRFSSDKTVGVPAQIRPQPALRAPHHLPGVQRPAAARPGAPADRRRAHPARHLGAIEAGLAARWSSRLLDGNLAAATADLIGRVRRRHPDRGHRQPARACQCEERAPLRGLVAGHPGRAGTGSDGRSRKRPGNHCRHRGSSPIWSTLVERRRAIARGPGSRRADPADPGRKRR